MTFKSYLEMWMKSSQAGFQASFPRYFKINKDLIDQSEE